MKIFHLTTKSEMGGAQTHILQLSCYLKENGHEVAIMACPGGWLEVEAKNAGIKFYPNQFIDNSISPMKNIKAIGLISKAIADFKPDLVACHSTKAGILGRLTIRNKIKTLFTAHGWAFTEGAPLRRKLPVIVMERICSNFCSKIICVSEHDRELALRCKIAPAEKLITLHNGTKVVKDIPPKDYSGTLKVIFLGRLAIPKDPFTLVKAVAALPDELKKKIEVSIIGGGPDAGKLNDLIKELKLQDRVKATGYIPVPDLLSALKESHIFVLVSDWEGLPLSILEAMSNGMAVIASSVGGVPELCRPDCSFLVQRRDVEGVKNALAKLISDPGLAKKMGERAHEMVLEEFSLEGMLEKTVGVYRSILLSEKAN